MSNDSRGYVSYRVCGLPTGSFGETYAIATGLVGDAGRHLAEFFVISKRYHPHLHAAAIEFVSDDIPDDVLTVDEDYLLCEARQQAQNYLDEALFEIAEKHGEHVLTRYRPEMIELRYMPLLSLWMRSELRDEIRSIAEKTKSPRLRLCLGMAMQTRMMRLQPAS